MVFASGKMFVLPSRCCFAHCRADAVLRTAEPMLFCALPSRCCFAHCRANAVLRTANPTGHHARTHAGGFPPSDPPLPLLSPPSPHTHPHFPSPSFFPAQACVRRVRSPTLAHTHLRTWIALRFCSSDCGLKSARPTVTCTLPVLSRRYSTLPPLKSLTACGQRVKTASGCDTVEERGQGWQPTASSNVQRGVCVCVWWWWGDRSPPHQLKEKRTRLATNGPFASHVRCHL
eukprot:354548-Chlamydomonas_euryale.AAC.7